MKQINAALITIGDEILYGQILDTNSQWMSVALDNVGIKVIRKTSVGDGENDILEALAQAAQRADIVLITGGLGPTKDDITKDCLCKFFDCGLTFNDEVSTMVSAFFARRNRVMSDANKSQAYLPTKCKAILNHHGTAPAMWFEQNDTVFVSMPGVPFEMKEMMSHQIIPQLCQQFTIPIIHHQWIKTVGMGESVIAEKIEAIENNLPGHIKLAYLPSLGEVRLRLTCVGDSLTELKSEAAEWAQKINNCIEEYVYSFENLSFIECIHHLLQEKNVTIATAESCTGGYIAAQLTSLSGSSQFFKGAIVAYHNDVKTNLLDIPALIIAEEGAVSEAVVRLMAENVRKKLQSYIGVSCSGVAGPTGGTAEKPVGTVWIAYSDPNITVAKKIILTNLRENNIKLTSINVLNLIRKNLK